LNIWKTGGLAGLFRFCGAALESDDRPSHFGINGVSDAPYGGAQVYQPLHLVKANTGNRAILR
jgi:hypothetical protein